VPAASVAARLGRAWFSILVLVSATLVLVTFLSFAVEGVRPYSTLFFWLGLAGENNVGAWWSGMLLLLASVFALDGFGRRRAEPAERRGWLALSAALLILSFDEIGSLHEYLASEGIAFLAVLAVPLFALTAYAWLQLFRSRKDRRTPGLLLLAFVLLGTVPVQEIIQHSREWPNPIIYGLRGALEEGIELTAILLLVAVTSRNTRSAVERGAGEAFELARHRLLVLAAAAALAPVLVAATFVLPYPGGPADWLASACYLGCALLVVRSLVGPSTAATTPLVVLLVWYLAASCGSTAVKLDWDPVVLGAPVSLRALFVALLLATAVPILRSAGRRASPLLFVGGAAAALVGSMWPQSQLLWCGFPVLVAVLVYAGESAVAAGVPLAADTSSGGVAMAGPAEG